MERWEWREALESLASLGRHHGWSRGRHCARTEGIAGYGRLRRGRTQGWRSHDAGLTVAQPLLHEGHGEGQGSRHRTEVCHHGGPPTPLPYPRQMGGERERDRGRGREETIETHPRGDKEGGAIVAPPRVGRRRLACRRLGETEREWGELRACFFFVMTNGGESDVRRLTWATY
jgi:hypothetical protein